MKLSLLFHRQGDHGGVTVTFRVYPSLRNTVYLTCSSLSGQFSGLCGGTGFSTRQKYFAEEFLEGSVRIKHKEGTKHNT
ncbi:hypothetical protein VZT92_022297 [Zoarces viviparus]|uniref:Uncharacterized protein n=1 Tax=Zoarces viviparus TaxID=48416 RepID=A0AAW1EBN4_ZOAVI